MCSTQCRYVPVYTRLVHSSSLFSCSDELEDEFEVTDIVAKGQQVATVTKRSCRQKSN
jgi:hypothetical protein